jgi:glycosyltransferase involved in cell wall biosynthesis
MIPVYNGAETLSECLESVLRQTYRNWECIVVDNRSTDRSAEIAEDYAKRDSRIRLHRNTDFVTAGLNHEVGFRLMSAASRYCKVVHADDWIFPECVERMVALAEANPSVVVVSSYRLEDARVTMDGLPVERSVVPGREICRLTLLNKLYLFGSPTSLLIRSEAIRSRVPFYDEDHYPRHWDTAVCYEILRDRDFGFVHQVLTFTRRSGAVRTPVSKRLGTLLPEHLLMVKMFGPIYLSPEEHEARMRTMLSDYRRFLGASFLKRAGREFWDYHGAARRRIAETGGRLYMAGAVVTAAWQQALRPFWAFRRPRRGAAR